MKIQVIKKVIGLMVLLCIPVIAMIGADQKEETSVIKTIKKKAKAGILVCAHRAFHKNEPENSISAIKASILANIDIIELDIRTSKDDSLVLMHDVTIDRTTTGTGKVKDLTFDELRAVRLLHENEPTSQIIPTLYEVLNEVQHKQIIINLDLKDVNVEQVYAALKRHDMQHQVISFIGNKQQLNKMLSLDPDFAVLPLAKSEHEIKKYEAISSPLIHLTEVSYTASHIRLAKNNGQLVFINSLFEQDETFKRGDFDSMRALLDQSPNIVQTDHPLLLKVFLEWRSIKK